MHYTKLNISFCNNRNATIYCYAKVKGVNVPCHFTKESGSLIEIVSISHQYGKVMGLIIENIFEDGKLHPKDYLHILYDTQMTELFKTLGKILKLVIFKITFLNYQY